jgi:outer membrane protein
MFRAGATTIAPQVNSGNLSTPSIPNTKNDVGSASQVSGGVTYMVTDNVSLDLPLALPFTHKLYGAGSIAAVGQVGEVKALPMTVFLQYRFMEPKSVFRPYVGLGATYAYFFNASGSGTLTSMTNPGGPPTTISVESKFAVTTQIGATIALDKQWFIDAFYAKTTLANKTTLSTGQTVDITLDPVSYGITLGYKF